MAKLRKKYPMYAVGTGPHGIGNAYLETPSGELAQNDINIAIEEFKKATNLDQFSASYQIAPA